MSKEKKSVPKRTIMKKKLEYVPSQELELPGCYVIILCAQVQPGFGLGLWFETDAEEGDPVTAVQVLMLPDGHSGDETVGASYVGSVLPPDGGQMVHIYQFGAFMY